MIPSGLCCSPVVFRFLGWTISERNSLFCDLAFFNFATKFRKTGHKTVTKVSTEVDVDKNVLNSFFKLAESSYMNPFRAQFIGSVLEFSGSHTVSE